MERDHFIDCAKGLCILSVVFIHTVFWSGSYIPVYVKNIALLFDIPVFFFLTGCLMSIKPNFNVFKQMAKIIMLFLTAAIVINFATGYCSLENIMQPIALSEFHIKVMPPISWAYWFVPVYLISVIYVIIIKDFLNKFWQFFILAAIPLYYVYSWFSQHVFTTKIFGVDLQLQLFYIWLMLLGFMTYKMKSKILWIMFIIISVSGLIIMNWQIEGFCLQNYKFVVHLPYVIASLASLGFIMIFQKCFRNNFLEFIGNKALYFYLTQAIGGAALFHVVPHIHLHWVFKMLICFGINLTITLLLGYLICLITKALTGGGGQKLIAKIFTTST